MQGDECGGRQSQRTSGTSPNTHQQVHALDDVQEHLVLPVADALRAPRHGVRHRGRRARLDLELVRFLGDVSGVG